MVELNRAYERFVPKEFLELLGKDSIVDVRLGDHVETETTVLFSDIRSFTSFSETMTPEENFNFVNGYLGRMEPIFADHHGFIDKYIGDAIMALFPHGPDTALRAAIAMLRTLGDYNRERREWGLREIRIGIGLNTGRAMLGTVGGTERMDGTVISDAVNLSERIETLTKTYKAPLLVSEFTRARLTDPGEFSMRLLDRVRVKGRRTPVAVYEVYDADEPSVRAGKIQATDLFEEGVEAHLAGDDRRAESAFTRLVAGFPQDDPARYWLNRIQGQTTQNAGDH